VQANKTAACKHFSMITNDCQRPPGSDFQTEGAGSIPVARSMLEAQGFTEAPALRPKSGA